MSNVNDKRMSQMQKRLYNALKKLNTGECSRDFFTIRPDELKTARSLARRGLIELRNEVEVRIKL